MWKCGIECFKSIGGSFGDKKSFSEQWVWLIISFIYMCFDAQKYANFFYVVYFGLKLEDYTGKYLNFAE